MSKTNRIEREKQIVQKMIAIYCRHHLKQAPAAEGTGPEASTAEEYQQLAEYACQRLDHCRFGEQKPVCEKCTVHCYAPKERQLIKEVMRWVGPRMMLYSPKDALFHVFNKVKTWLQSPVIQDGCNSVALLHTVLHPLLRPDAAAHKRGGEGNTLDGTLRHGKDLPVWRPHHSGCRGL